MDVSLNEILSYTVSHSDNNGCDKLFELAGGTAKVNSYIHSIGVSDINIVATEYQMAQAWDVQYTNWCTPFAMAQLLERLYYKKDVGAKTNAFLMDLMEKTQTGPKRIRGLLPAGTIVADKTGTSDTNKNGITAATNDVGIITLPNGRHVAIAVFVSDSKEDHDTNEKIIALIARITYDYFAKS